MPSNQTIRAIDIGYGNTKFVVDDRFTCRLFPSIAPRADIHRERGGLGRDRRTTDVWVDGCPFEVGPDTSLFSEIPVLHADYIETPEYRALLYGALDAMQLTRIDLLVTGLPVRLHGPRANRLKQLLTGVHAIRPGMTVEIQDVAVVMQPLGGFLAYSHERGDWSSAQNQTYLLVDPGFYTFDWMVTRGMNEMPGLSGSIDCGVSEYVKCVQDELNRDLGEAYFNLRRIDDGLRCGHFRLRGRPIDLEPYRIHAERVVARAMRAMRNAIGTGEEIDEIVLVGGGGPYFIQGLHQAFPNQPVQTVKDPVFANLRGFQLVGRILQRRKAA